MKVIRWNIDKPHRCPGCHAIVAHNSRPSRWRVYECCHCFVRFARLPWLSSLLPLTGCDYEEHASTVRSDAATETRGGTGETQEAAQ